MKQHDPNTLADQVERAEAGQTPAYDKTGRPIMVGDVLKVYHFQGARWRKHYYMFKQVVGTKVFAKSGREYLMVSHLNMKDWDDRDGGYTLAQDGTTHDHVEIVQGLDWHHDRPRLAPTPSEEP